VAGCFAVLLSSMAVPGKGWFTLFRLYGPKKEFFDLSWKLNDIEKVK
jgi:hypothetical protein